MNIAAWLKCDLSSPRYCICIKIKSLDGKYSSSWTPQKWSQGWRSVWALKTWYSVHVLGSTSVNLDLVFDLQRVWTGQRVAFSCAWPTLHIHCNSMWFVNSLHCRVRSNTHKQPSGAFSPQRELDTQHYMLHLKQDQLDHTLKNKGKVDRSCSSGECWLGPPSKSLQQPRVNSYVSYVFMRILKLKKVHLRWFLILAKKA